MAKNNKKPIRYGANANIYNQGGAVAQAAFAKTPAWKIRLAQQAQERADKEASKGLGKGVSGSAGGTTYNPNAYQTPAESLAQTPSIPGYSGYGGYQTPMYYQVNKDDKSLDDIALRHNVPLGYLSALNQTKTLPPKGSFLQLMAAGVPSTIANQAASALNRPYVPARPNIPRNYASGDESIYRGAQGQLYQINAQLANGQLPANIPVSYLSSIRDAEGQTTTVQEWIAEGYVLKDGVLHAPGSPGAKTATNSGRLPPPSAEFMQTKGYQYGYDASTGQLNMNALRWDPSTKKYVSIAKLVKQGKLNMKTGKFNKYGNKQYRRRRRNNYDAPAPAPAPVETVRSGPETILDLHLGSG